jgi:hypothetical protein
MDELYYDPKLQRVAPRGNPASVHANAVRGRSTQKGRNGNSVPEKYCRYFALDASLDGAASG